MVSSKGRDGGKQKEGEIKSNKEVKETKGNKKGNSAAENYQQ